MKSKPKRVLLGIIVVAGVLILILGFFGVFSRGFLGIFSSPKDDGDLDPLTKGPDESPLADGEARVTVEEGFKVEGDNWVLTAERAEFMAEQGYNLTKPNLHAWDESPKVGDQVHATAERGSYMERGERNRKITMSGSTHIRYISNEDMELFTESLEVDPDDGIGTTDAPVRIISTTEEGSHILTGTGAEFRFNDRTADIRQDIRMEIAGAAPLFPSEDEGAEKAGAAPPTVITCDGPCMADGFKRTVVMNGNVLVKQGDGELTSREFEIIFGDETRAQQRLTAKGDVRFKFEGADGRCDRLVRTETGSELLLEGRPAKVRQDKSAIEAGKITMHSVSGRIFVPVPGKVAIEQQTPDGEDDTLNVDWQENMELDRSDHRAFFRGDVRFDYGPQKIDCQRLTVRFDEETGDMVSCHAEDGVNLSGRLEPPPPTKGEEPAKPEPIEARADDLLYTPPKDSLVLSGKAMVDHPAQIVKGERIEMKQSDGSVRVRGAGSLQTRPGPAADVTPMKVKWTGEMAYDRPTRKAIFRRDVELDQGTRKLAARKLDANVTEDNTLGEFEAGGDVVMDESLGAAKGVRKLHSRKLVGIAGADNALETLEATGNVRMVEGVEGETPTRQLRAKRFRADMGEANAIEGFNATGDVEMIEPQADRKLDADQLVGKIGPDNALTGFEATGKVVLEEGAGEQSSPRILKTKWLNAEVGDTNELERIVTRGDTTIVEEGSTANGERLVWDLRKDLGVLQGDPVELIQGEQRVVGDTIEFARERGRFHITSRYGIDGALLTEQEVGAALP